MERHLFAAIAALLACECVVAQPAGPDTTLCNNFYTMQPLPLDPGETGIWVLVTGCATIVSPAVPNTLVTNICTGANWFQWQVLDGLGGFFSYDVWITVLDTSVTANAGPDQVVCLPSTSTVLAATPVDYPYGYWSFLQGSGVLSAYDWPTPEITGLSPGETILLWTVDYGCAAATTDSVTISVEVCEGIGTALAPPTISISAVNGGCITVQGQDPIERLTVLDVMGNELAAFGEQYHNWTVSCIPGLPVGVYVVLVESKGDRSVSRFMLE